MLDSVAKKLGVPWDDAEAAAIEAAAAGWLTIEGGHSVCLTDAGNRLDAPPSTKPKARSDDQRAAKAQGRVWWPANPGPFRAEALYGVEIGLGEWRERSSDG